MLDLEPIKKREQRATPRPWHVGYCMIWPEQISSASDAVAECSGTNAGADMDFITHAREDVPALIAEVEFLRVLLDGGYRTAQV